MQHPFQKRALQEIEEFSEILTKYGYKVTIPDKKLYNYEVIVNNKTDQLKIQVYFGKKGIKKVLQGNPESILYKKISGLWFGNILFSKTENNEHEFSEYIGTDESGKGDYFGPLVVSAVYINEKTKIELEAIGVKDSKLLSDNNIKVIEKKIKSIISDNYSVVLINPERYNSLYESFKNLNKIMGWAHTKAIENLLSKVNCQNVISDKFGNENLIKNELSKKNLLVNIIQTTKGERFTAVAAASILAREKVLDWFFYKSKEIGFEIPKGGGQNTHNIAQQIIEKYDENYLRNLIKFHFKNSKSIFKK